VIHRVLLGICLIGSALAATLPRPAAEFVIHDPRGEQLLSQYRGKVMVLAFLFTT